LNNLAEQGIRKAKLQQKNHRTFRNEEGGVSFEGSERIAQQERKMIGRFRLLLLVLSMGFLSPLLLIRGPSER